MVPKEQESGWNPIFTSRHFQTQIKGPLFFILRNPGHRLALHYKSKWWVKKTFIITKMCQTVYCTIILNSNKQKHQPTVNKF